MSFAADTPREYEFQMTSFVDVIFVLLSFFVLGTTFISERDVALGYRGNISSPGAKAEDFPQEVNVELRCAAGGVAITVGKGPLGENDFEAIRAKLTQINMPGISVLVLAEADLSVDQVAKAVDAVMASPMKKVSIARLAAATAGKARPAGAAVEAHAK